MSQLDAGTNRSAVSTNSRLIQPLVSTEALSELTSIVPGIPQLSWSGIPQPARSIHSLLTTRSVGASRYRQVLLTGIPLLLADLAALVICFLVAAGTTRWVFGMGGAVWHPNNLTAATLCYLLGAAYTGLLPAAGMNPVCELRHQIQSIAGAFLLLLLLNGVLGAVTLNEVITMSLAFPMAVVLGPLARFGMRRLCSQASWWGEKVMIVGSYRHGRSIFDFLKQMPQRGLKPVGLLVDEPSEYWDSAGTETEISGTTEDIVNVCRSKDCHWVIAAVADRTEPEVRHLLTQCSLIPNLVVLNTNLLLPTMWATAFDAAGLAGVLIRDRLLFPFQRLLKRVFDVLLSSFLLILAGPLFAGIALWIKVSSPGPILFRHNGRIGRDGRAFGAWKIRTMEQNAEQILQQYLKENMDAAEEWQRDLKLKNDPRIIRGIGHFLRKTSLDELPQLWNVLVGDMSLVGPRPIYTDIEIEKFRELFPLYLRVRPGLTGLWQVSGRNNTSYDDRVRLDSYYVRNWSLWLDYFILLRTVRTLLLREGAY
jgi:Undecaprenyl-phosphate galactose phosphotransferase WbaP